MNTHEPLVDIVHQIAPIAATLRGNRFNFPKDESTDTQCSIPIRKETLKASVQVGNTFSVSQPVVVGLYNARGFKLSVVYVTFKLPAQYASKQHDAFAYDSLPGIQCINQIEVTIGQRLQTETLRPQAIIQRLVNYYGPQWMIEKGSKYLGGVRTDKVCDFNQKLTYCRMPFNSETKTNNIIKPEIQIFLPLPIHFLFNRETFCFLLANMSALECKFLFRNITDWSSYTKDFTPLAFTGTLEYYVEALNPCEQASAFSSLPYTIPVDARENDYYFNDCYYESSSKRNPYTSDVKCQIAQTCTKSLSIYINDNSLATGYTFYGDTVASASANFIQSFLFTDPIGLTPSSTISLNKGKFVDTSSQSFGLVEITAFTSNSITLTYNKKLNLVITSSTPWELFDNLYLNFDAIPLAGPSGINTPNLVPNLFHLSSFNLDVQPWSKTDPRYSEDRSVSEKGSSYLLVGGCFTFTPDPVTFINKYALVKINNIQINDGMTADTWSLLISQRISEPSNPNIFATKSYVIIHRNCSPYLTLDNTLRLEIEELRLEKGGSNSELYGVPELLLNDYYTSIPHYWSPQVCLEYSYKNKFTNVDTLGYIDYRIQEVLDFVPKFKNIPIMFMGNEITTFLKDRTASLLDFNIFVIQESLRTFKYDTDGILSYLYDDEREQLNTAAYIEVLNKHNMTNIPLEVMGGITPDQSQTSGSSSQTNTREIVQYKPKPNAMEYMGTMSNNGAAHYGSAVYSAGGGASSRNAYGSNKRGIRDQLARPYPSKRNRFM